MSDGGKEAVSADDAVVAAAEVRRLEERLRERERVVGRGNAFADELLGTRTQSK